MYKYTLLVFLFALNIGNASGQTKPNYLYKIYTDQGKSSTLSTVDSIKITELAHIKDMLHNIPESSKKQIIANADKALANPWGVLLLTQFNEFSLNGNRVNFENKYFERRNKLTALLIGEIVERKGRYLPEIINGLGLILEESTWALPAHMKLQKAGVGIPDVEEPIIDLFDAQTAALVAWTRFLMKDELNKFSPLLVKRIDYELNRRVFEPYITRNNFSWMGFRGGQLNNWTTFINTNVLTTTMLAQEDKTKRAAIIEKSILSMDNFLNDYPADGGCDEGPSYWTMAGASLVQYLDMLSTYSNKRLDFSKNDLIHNIGTYIYKVHIDDKYYVNFADAGAIVAQDPSKIYAFGKLFNDQQLLGFAAYVQKVNNAPGGYNLGDINSFINALSVTPALNNITPKAPQVQQSWLPNLQVLTLRQNASSAKGLFFAAKGGNNNESHNHNDVGNFILYKDGMPVIVDAGVGTYTKQTFSKDRYKLWFMQSGWHNCPAINGVDQQNGPNFKAKQVSYTQSKSQMKLRMDLASAYPATAQVNSWLRTFTFSPSKGILTLNEVYNLKKALAPVTLNFLVDGTVTEESKGHLKLTNPTGQTVSLTYDPNAFDFKVENKPITDARLASSWKTSLNRVTLIVKGDELKGNKSVVFR